MTSTKRTVEKPITIGSGTCYLKEYEGTMPTVDEMCVEANRFAYTKNGATITYSTESQEVSDDLGKIRKTVFSGDSATIGLGVLGWIGDTLKKGISTASSTIDGNRRITKIGGTGNDDGKRYVVCFHHEDEQDGDCWWMGVGKNTNGLEIQYQMEDGSVFNPTFTLEPYDESGHLLWFEEEIVGGSTSSNAG